jgi:hypothetical protein
VNKKGNVAGAQDLADLRRQLSRRERPPQAVLARGPPDGGVLLVGGEEDHRDGGIDPDLVQDADAGDAGQAQVEEYHVGRASWS